MNPIATDSISKATTMVTIATTLVTIATTIVLPQNPISERKISQLKLFINFASICGRETQRYAHITQIILVAR